MEKISLPMTEDANAAARRTPYGIAKYAVELDLKEGTKVRAELCDFPSAQCLWRIFKIGDRYRNVIGISMKTKSCKASP